MFHSPNIARTDSPHEVTRRENYQDLAGAVGIIHEATEEVFGPLATAEFRTHGFQR